MGLIIRARAKRGQAEPLPPDPLLLLRIHRIQRFGLHLAQAGLQRLPLAPAGLIAQQRPNLNPVNSKPPRWRHPARHPAPAAPGLGPQCKHGRIAGIDPVRLCAARQPRLGLGGLLVQAPGLEIGDELVRPGAALVDELYPAAGGATEFPSAAPG